MAVTVSAIQAIEKIKSGQRVFIHGAAMAPQVLIGELVAQADRLQGVELIHMHTEGPAPYAEKKYADHFKVANLFVGPNIRPALDLDRVDYVPTFLSEIGLLFRSGRRKPDVALVHVSPPDAHGYCSLGTSVDVARAAIETANLVIAQVNPQVPRMHGDGLVHEKHIDFFVEADEPLFTTESAQPGETDRAIGKNVASLVEDGATLQVGIGAIPNAVLECLKDHKHLGIHSEMWTDGVLNLIESGAVDNSQKTFHRGKSVASFVLGSARLYRFVHDNPSTILLESSYVNNPGIIARNKKVVAINSAVEVDLTGQVCADSIGPHIISGVGGQIDFIRGASFSEGGKPIIALPARTRKGLSRIVCQLKPGAGVVTTRAHVHYVVTEYGVADLFGRTIGERARELIRIAHPEDRESLTREWSRVRGS